MGGNKVNHKKQLDKKKIGEKLYKLIHASPYTYEYVAEFLELKSARVIYEWTNGTKTPNTENLWNLAELLNVHMEDILS